jgi:hypothetical protein
MVVVGMLCFLLISCQEKSPQLPETHLNEESNDQNQTIIESGETNTVIDLDRHETRYVNSPEGLRVRDKPDVEGERLFVLENNHEVLTLKTDTNDTVIDGITGNWVYIRSTSNEAQGWVFGGYLSKEKNLSVHDFKNHIMITNGTLTDAYSVPPLTHYLIGLPDDPPNPIEEHSIEWRYGGIQICLNNSISPEDAIIVTMKNDRHAFSKTLKLFSLHNEKGISGYYGNIDLEIKPWTVTDEDNAWRLIVHAGQDELINETRALSYAGSLLFDTVDDSPFVITNLNYVEVHKKYTYRFLNERADILILYYSPDNSVYKPVLYVTPHKNNVETSTDIGISWDNEMLKGKYYIGNYTLDTLPTEEERAALFDFIEVR